MIELIPDSIHAASEALATLGYRPNVPITAEQFALPENREHWMREKDMKVLQLWSDQRRQTPIDVFIQVPFDFAGELAVAPTRDLTGVGAVPIVTLRTLVAMKPPPVGTRIASISKTCGCVTSTTFLPMPDEPTPIDWSLTTWDGSRREQLRRWSQLTMDEILEAQEEMADLATEIGGDAALAGRHDPYLSTFFFGRRLSPSCDPRRPALEALTIDVAASVDREQTTERLRALITRIREEVGQTKATIWQCRDILKEMKP